MFTPSVIKREWKADSVWLLRRWVVLQDCHLAGPWLDTLQSALDELKGNPNLHDNFRLWLTTLPANIPTELLHTRWGGPPSAQMTTQGVLANFCRRKGAGRPSECVDECENHLRKSWAEGFWSQKRYYSTQSKALLAKLPDAPCASCEALIVFLLPISHCF